MLHGIVTFSLWSKDIMQPDDLDQYDDDDEIVTPRRRSRERPKAKPKRSQRELLSELSDGNIEAAKFTTTYRPSRYEAEWLLSSLGMFYEEQLITDVLAQVKGGKEATVYCCQAHPSTGMDLLAAKVYRPKQFRSLSNDAMYREGRQAVTSNVRAALNGTGRKVGRLTEGALSKKTKFGAQLQHTSWIAYEFSFMGQLHRVGASVPKPIASADNAILMSYYGELGNPAPLLVSVQLKPKEAKLLFEETMRSIDLMLQQGFIHGDLSAYNILYWKGEIAIIDFPQVSSIANNPSALAILQRDIIRICEYFSRYGVRCNPVALADELWERFGGM